MAEEIKAAPPAKPCPICGKAMVLRYKPFCSSRCGDIDLGRWLKGAYVIPGKPLPQEGEDEEQDSER